MSSEHFRKALELAKGKRPKKSNITGTNSAFVTRNLKRLNAQDEANEIEHIEYTQTQVQTIDDEVLRENRVIAGFRNDPRSSAFRILRTQLLHELDKRDQRSIGITAAHSGAGKSLISSNLAVSISLLKNRTVLLVDLDLRNPSIHKYFNLDKNRKGIADYLEDNADLSEIFVNPGIERLVILPGYSPSDESSELLSTKKAKYLFKELRNNYPERIVIYDLPPLIGLDDTMVVLPLIETGLLVVEANRTTVSELTHSLSLIDKEKLLGTIFNKSDSIENLNYEY